MNLYFLVEGKSTETKVYPAWLAYLLPEIQKVEHYDQVSKNNYVLFSGYGYPSIIYDHLPNAIADIQVNGNYDYLVVCLDADEVTVDERKQEVSDFLNNNAINLGNTELVIVVQNRCFESWCLGNRKIYSKNPQSSPLLDYTRYYNVSVNCPELMGKYQKFNTHAQFHKAYLREIFKAKGIKYSEKNPGDVLESYYLKELETRIEQQKQHLLSFQEFIKFCKSIKHKLST
ncbi:hypothetical protein JYQ62_28045 [Nostoc sp. UHCC 0702]|nr:hypothetical protein JYQ62_28045 [Nostoc sp. UHCC 0702]